ncbi:MAG: universal stress protein [Furfurilactobacillus sp.]|jgi:nucleotide-binding universal stress UspA family protein|uniref:Universal stress protein n=2 Tax=Furfurilactobacillus TaxID=2767882 RepID=A0ABT6D6D0_9LACO|nr:MULTISPECIES: universal stress protein [Furfurilactobacillus]QLE66274.1 Universal stress protein [Furfurilactobacillus rossiae]MCF6159732.1 universal stress protein [Furfurilactobacillus milii]MCF6163183.1 universal stress protein [Furfurilactobacillus milii]MCF6419112.1 universal stress protein [Furfurilactobacillus milii]MCH4011013.1 universal stress protein [Furfurilactobacillus sp.]
MAKSEHKKVQSEDDIIKGKVYDYKRVLVGVDDSPDAQLAYQYAVKQAKEDKSELVIVSILEEQDVNVFTALSKEMLDQQRKTIQERLDKYRRVAENSGVKSVKTLIAEGDPGETIVKQVIPQVDPDLVIVGSLSRQGVAKYFGSQAAYVAKYSPVSVLVVR